MEAGVTLEGLKFVALKFVVSETVQHTKDLGVGGGGLVILSWTFTCGLEPLELSQDRGHIPSSRQHAIRTVLESLVGTGYPHNLTPVGSESSSVLISCSFLGILWRFT